MILSFHDEATEDVFNGVDSKKARRLGGPDVIEMARRKLTVLNAASSLTSLRVPPGNRLEALKGDRNGQHSIRVNSQYRICFTWTDKGPIDVEIVDYH
jgi:toxin HigB-1